MRAVASTHASNDTAAELKTLATELEKVLRGKPEIVETVLCVLGSSGHLLLEDVPGVGKTTVVKALSKLLGLSMSRVQCTSDLLPSDILGVEVFSPQKEKFVFHPGPIFSQIVFVDELNRCSPRTQSALLEAMAEGSVTLNRNTHELPKPFLVFATQNPSDYSGTYALPESQLDRFAARVQMGYPHPSREKEILQGAQKQPLDSVPSGVVSADFCQRLELLCQDVELSTRLIEYAFRLVEATRQHPAVLTGVSTRGAVSWLRMAKAKALLAGRNYVIPDDITSLAQRCLAHRMVLRGASNTATVLAEVLNQTSVE